MTQLIQLKNLSIQSDSTKIIDQFSMDVQKNEVVSLVGPSGSGKSTILKYLAQMQDPTLSTSGEYYYNGENVDQMNFTDLRKSVSYCFQSPTLFGNTVKDNLKFAYDIRDLDFDSQSAKELLNNVNLPSSYLDKDITTLSGGEKQRVALIRNLQFTPRVLLLDEITSGLDKKTREIIWRWLKQYKEDNNSTIVLVSHTEEEQNLADRIITIKKISTEGADT
ncbi:ATP-binding cassette domain-containing protein [Aerococcaceae bacterium WGS1372]